MMDLQKDFLSMQIAYEKNCAIRCNCSYEELKAQLDRSESLFGTRYLEGSPRHENWLLWVEAWQAAKAVPGKTVQLHLVWNENKDECVGFLNQGDAHYTATGNDGGAWGVTTLGDYFRDINDESDEFETQIVMIEARESANE